MSGAVDAPARGGGIQVTIRPIHVALAVSLLVHALALWEWLPQMRLAAPLSERPNERGPLELRLEQAEAQLSPPVVPPPSRVRPEAPTVPRQAQPKRAERVPERRPEPPPPPRMTAPAAPAERPAYAAPEPVPVPPPAPEPQPAPAARAPADTDLSSFIASRRRARGQAEVPSPATEESESERAKRIAAANLGAGKTPTYGGDATGGGIFQIQRLTYDYAEYLFFGWNADIRRNATQVVTVRKGPQPDIQHAVVRSMIEIIRRHEQGDFLWESRRLGRNVNLSARPSDDAGLEDFLMREFFEVPRPVPYSRFPG